MRIVFAVLTLFISNSSFAKLAEPQIFTTYVFADGGESVESLLFDKYKLPVEVLYDKKYMEKVTKWNWFVENPKKLLPGERIYIELPYRYKVYFEKNERNVASTQPTKIVYVEKKPKYNPGIAQEYIPPSKDINLSVNFTTSVGSIIDTNKELQLKGTSSQNSPLTIGFFLTLKSDKERFSYSTSFYSSYLVGMVQNDTNEVEVPLELGTNFYVNYNYKNLNNIYFGLDAERISSFNIDSIQNTETFYSKEHSILYATFGYFNIFKVFSKNVFFKMGVSQSLYSQTNIENSGDDSPYSGIRGIAFLSTNISRKLTLNFLAKQHLLTGPSELSITRFGLGLGYQFY